MNLNHIVIFSLQLKLKFSWLQGLGSGLGMEEDCLT